MFQRLYFPPPIAVVMLFLCGILQFSIVSGAVTYAPHLEAIGYDRILEDSRFSGLTGAGQALTVLDTGLDPDHVMLKETTFEIRMILRFQLLLFL